MTETSTTMMFEYNIKKLKTNPFHVETAFGKPIAIGLGNEFERADKLQEMRDELVEALMGTQGLGFSKPELERRFDPSTVKHILKVEAVLKKAKGEA